MIKIIKRLLGIKPKKHEMNNTKFKWNNEYSFHPAIDESLHPPTRQKDKNDVE